MECIADDEQTNFERALSAQMAVHIGTLSRRMVESCIHAFDYIIQCVTFNSQSTWFIDEGDLCNLHDDSFSNIQGWVSRRVVSVAIL